MTQVVLGSIVTYSAGLNIPSLITGFETCTLYIKNLPLRVREDEVRGLFTQQGINIHRFHLVGMKKGTHEKLEAQIVSDADAGRALAEMLDGLDFKDETLAVEVSANNTLEGMSATASRDSEVLMISWRVPSVRYVAEFLDMAVANEKVRRLDRRICAGRRVKVEINTLPPGRVIRDFRPNSIKINFLPPSITDEEVIAFTGSSSVKRLAVGGHLGVISVEEAARMLRNDIERAVPNALRQFNPPSGSPSPEGVVSARARFSSWDEAHAAHISLSDKRYGNQPTWFKLPDPMHFTITIPSEQYTAQKAQWDGLLSSIKDRKACILNVHSAGSIVRIRLSGSVKEAIGALKVRVENLARGEPVEGWHRCLSFSNNPFPRHVFVETGAYLRADWKRQSLKVYGASRAIDQARDLIKSELERLASMDYTVTLANSSVGFFVREGIPQLKETLGENNIRFAMNTRKITVTGGDDARHALERLVALSLDNNHSLPNASEGGQTCPICYDDVTSPHQLGCGHVYCTACLRHYISSSLESAQLPLTCLGDETHCHVPIPIPTIQHFLPPASFNRLLEAAVDSYISKHPEEFKFCKTPDCGQIYRSVRPGESAKSLRCPSCFAAVCNACDDDAHDGMTCAESKVHRDPAEQDRLNDAWIASQGGRVKKCPRCSVIIEKTEGCNHMSCRCGAHICWRCMGVFTEQTIYTHMHSAHGGIHGDEPVVPNPIPAIRIDPILAGVDVEQQRRLLDEAQRMAQLRRAAEIRDLNANRAAEAGGYFDRMNRIREEERRQREQRRVHELMTQQAEQERQQRERERRQREWERQQRERERARQDSGWGCTIM
ncbi:hypothetical protein OG21DRAFT_543542 [Imleria badia]|nr:hypothetical protein OG21DRAFT_543542 [Imleria badia]